MSKKYTKLAGRYASALQKAVAESNGDAAQVAGELERVAELWKSESGLAASLQNPLFSKIERLNSLNAVMDSLNISDVVRRFVAIVFQRDRIKALEEISKVFSRRIEETAGIVRVSVKVARELGADERSQIESSLQSEFSGRAEYQWKVEPEILGGLVVEYEGHILDGSISGRLDRLERQLLR